MFDSHALYKKRLSSHVKNLSRYLKYMFNGHIAFAMFFSLLQLLIIISSGWNNYRRIFRLESSWELF